MLTRLAGGKPMVLGLPGRGRENGVEPDPPGSIARGRSAALIAYDFAEAQEPMKLILLAVVLLASILATACAPSPASPTPLPTSTELPPSRTPEPTETLVPTHTPIPPTPTTTPQPLLLRHSCRRELVVRAGEPVMVYYGGWAVKGKELAQV